MKSIRTMALAVAILMVCAGLALAINKPIYDTGYPKTGNNAGEILVKGTTQMDEGWTPTGSGQIVAWPVGGGATTSQSISVRADGTWGEASIGGLTSGTNYNVVVQVTLRAGTGAQVFASDPKQAVAK